MNGLQIATLLSMDGHTSRYFKGFAWKDSGQLKEIEDALYILNTDVQKGVGEHWCAVSNIGDGQLEFWDPYGSPPEAYELERLLEAASVIYNPICVQSLTSNVCGNHCLFYAFLKCRGYSLNEILCKYDPGDLRQNDKMVEKFVNQFGTGYKIGKT